MPIQGQRIGVIGAGVSGLVAARTLARVGHFVTLFDKARGPGGRICSRRAGELGFDHGAQYVTARDPRFRDALAELVEDGIVAEWSARFASIRRGSVCALVDQEPRWVGVPRMSALARRLGEGLEIRTQSRVETLRREGGRWRLTLDDASDAGDFDLAIVTTAPLQARPLLGEVPTLQARVARASCAPCWCVLLAFEAPLDVDFDGAFVEDSPLAWVARNSSKPGRPGVDTWVLHASSEWSLRHLEEEGHAVLESLLAAFAEALGRQLPVPSFTQAHRWRYALPVDLLDEGFLWDEEARVGVAGDWCHGSRVEGAFLSGAKLADHVLTWLARSP